MSEQDKQADVIERAGWAIAAKVDRSDPGWPHAAAKAAIRVVLDDMRDYDGKQYAVTFSGIVTEYADRLGIDLAPPAVTEPLQSEAD